jgi:hypothetical protein
MTLHFATFFDKNYIPKGLILLESLEKHTLDFRLHVLCLDTETKTFLDALQNIHLLTFVLSEVENYYPELAEAKSNRSKVEYYFTLSPFLPDYILTKTPEIEFVTTLDADIMFFSDPRKLFAQEFVGKSILISPHRFTNVLKYKEMYGKYNVSFQSFRNDKNARECLRWWKGKCVEWCYDVLEENRFADQKYLDTWPERFEGVAIIQNPGAALAPWNLAPTDMKEANGEVLIQGQPIIFYHYHYFRLVTKNIVRHNLASYHITPNSLITNAIYKPYLEKLNAIEKKHGLADAAIRYSNNSMWKRILEMIAEEEFYLIVNGKFVNCNLTFVSPIYNSIKAIKKFLWRI